MEKLNVAGKLGVRPVAAYLNWRVDRCAEWWGVLPLLTGEEIYRWPSHIL
jgi:hypothetical protein